MLHGMRPARGALSDVLAGLLTLVYRPPRAGDHVLLAVPDSALFGNPVIGFESGRTPAAPGTDIVNRRLTWRGRPG